MEINSSPDRSIYYLHDSRVEKFTIDSTSRCVVCLNFIKNPKKYVITSLVSLRFLGQARLYKVNHAFVHVFWFSQIVRVLQMALLLIIGIVVIWADSRQLRQAKKPHQSVIESLVVDKQ